MGYNLTKLVMSVKVIWGNEHPIYQKSNKELSIPNRWSRYSENMKRGWVLNCESGRIKTTHLEKIGGLVKLDKFKNNIWEELYKNPSEENYSFYMDVLELLLEEHFPNIKDFDKWGLEGDEYSPLNNPFSEKQN